MERQLLGHYLCSATNLAEQAPEVRAPFSCSMQKRSDIVQTFRFGGFRLNGIIGGGAYTKLSVLFSGYSRMFGGDLRKAAPLLNPTFGNIPEDIDIPLVPISARTWGTKTLPGLIGYFIKMNRI